ncbi:MAG: type II toxin-antitoxin system RelE/ParE family toxin [Alphaproteobacteria bacterium]
MIRSFRCKKTERLFKDIFVSAFSGIERQGRKRLLILHAAKELKDLEFPPGNKLEKLLGDRHSQYSIRINDQWRICFEWIEGEASNVEITDYH